MTYSSKSYDTLLQESLTALAAQTNITQLGPGAKARALLEIINARLAGAYQYLDQQVANTMLASAQGIYLDLLGDLLACPRRSASYARAEAGAENVYLYVSTGTFGDLNSGNDIVVPAGTIISTLALDGDQSKQVSYRTTEETVLPAAGNKAYLSVEALLPGSLGAVGSRALRSHSLAGYQDTILVDNAASINNGRDAESDESYRWRLSRQVTAAAAANETAVRLACLAVPGVADVVLHPYSRGAGSFDVYVLATTGEPSPALLQAVQEAIDQQQALGIHGRARAPIPVGLQFQALVYLTRAVSDLEAAILTEQLRHRTVTYLASFKVGQEFLVNNLLAELISASNLIRTIGEPNRPLEQLYIWKPSRTGNGRRRYTLTGNYKTKFNERIQLEIQENLLSADFRFVPPTE